jgi:uncharacterized protein
MSFEPGRPPAVGMASTESLPDLLKTEPGLVDFVEVPFEQMAHTPAFLDQLGGAPIILHCASLSLAGDLAPRPDVVESLGRWIAASRTPWLGEHLAYISMSSDDEERERLPFAPSVDGLKPGETDTAHNVAYTVSPQYSAPILDRVSAALDNWESRFGVPVLVENSPVYFTIPGSTMHQAEFISALCRSRDSTGLIVDLSHISCTAFNTGWEPEDLLEAFPLEHVVEVHLSGFAQEAGVTWDDHSVPIDGRVFGLLERLLRRGRPRAVTIEYNWDAQFPAEIARRDLTKARDLSRKAYA